MEAEGEESGEVEEDRWYLRRLEGGLYTLQTVDYILAWVCMEDDGVRPTLKIIIIIITGPIDPGTHPTDDVPQRAEYPRRSGGAEGVQRQRRRHRRPRGDDPRRERRVASQREILGGLIGFLEGVP